MICSYLVIWNLVLIHTGMYSGSFPHIMVTVSSNMCPSLRSSAGKHLSNLEQCAAGPRASSRINSLGLDTEFTFCLELDGWMSQRQYM